jgi:hypothetical protein
MRTKKETEKKIKEKQEEKKERAKATVKKQSKVMILAARKKTQSQKNKWMKKGINWWKQQIQFYHASMGDLKKY